MTTTTREDAVTTVKVPRSLRERITKDAAEVGQTAAGFLTIVVDRWEREQRLAAVRRAYEAVDDEYRDDSEAWDPTNTDGLHD